MLSCVSPANSVVSVLTFVSSYSLLLSLHLKSKMSRFLDDKLENWFCVTKLNRRLKNAVASFIPRLEFPCIAFVLDFCAAWNETLPSLDSSLSSSAKLVCSSDSVLKEDRNEMEVDSKLETQWQKKETEERRGKENLEWVIDISLQPLSLLKINCSSLLECQLLFSTLTVDLSLYVCLWVDLLSTDLHFCSHLRSSLLFIRCLSLFFLSASFLSTPDTKRRERMHCCFFLFPVVGITGVDAEKSWSKFEV